MGMFNWLKAEKKVTADKVGSSTNSTLVEPPQNDLFKAYIPNFLYKPPFGYPLNKNVLLLKNMAKNPYIFSVIKTLKDEASTTKWEIKVKKEFVEEMAGDAQKDKKPNPFDKGSKPNPFDKTQDKPGVKAEALGEKDNNRTAQNPANAEKMFEGTKGKTPTDSEGEDLNNKIKEISKWFYNPNGNEESFNDIIAQWIQDLCEVDAFVGVKVFDKTQKFSQLFARDGGSFLKNPDIYGYMGGRDEFVFPIKDFNPNMTMPYKIKIYGAQYSESAAYFQYGWTGNALPVPFGRREIIYGCINPRTDSIYGRSPLEILNDTIMTLVYGQQYNLDYYINGNAPDGMILLQGADQEIAEAFQKRMLEKFKVDDSSLAQNRRMGHRYPVYGGPEAKFVPFSLSAKDMEILEQQRWFTKLVWSCFGVTAEQMGYTEHSNKATSQNQSSVFKKKALRPMLKKIEYAINTQLMTELDPSGKLEFVFEDYDVEEDMKRMQLYALQIQTGIKTSEMVAAEEGIDLKKLRESRQIDIDRQQQMYYGGAGGEPGKGQDPTNPKDTNPKDGKDNKSKQFQGKPATKSMAQERKMGYDIESEHADTINWIKEYYKNNGFFPSNKMVFEKIAEDHLDEFKNYYSKLKEMERELKNK